jgi:hypothetical protein
MPPFGPILGRDTVLQLRSECLLVAVEMLQQAGVPHPMEVVGMAVENDLPHIPALVAVVLVMQRLMEVIDKVNNKLEGFGIVTAPVCVLGARLMACQADPIVVGGVGCEQAHALPFIRSGREDG